MGDYSGAAIDLVQGVNIEEVVAVPGALGELVELEEVGDHRVEQARGSLDQVLVAVGDGIEGAGIDGADGHGDAVVAGSRRA